MDGNTDINTSTNDITVVGGYRFDSRADAAKARKELEYISRIKDRLDSGNAAQMQNIYLKLAERKYFTTPVGLNFMHELRAYIKALDPNREVPFVPVPGRKGAQSKITESPQYVMLSANYDKTKEENFEMRRKSSKMTIFLVALIVIIIGMFWIVITSDNLGYFNAEDKVLNKYSSWEEELNKREAAIKQREEELGIKP